MLLKIIVQNITATDSRYLVDGVINAPDDKLIKFSPMFHYDFEPVKDNFDYFLWIVGGRDGYGILPQ